MKKHHVLVAAAALAVAVPFAPSALAGPYTDDLSKCLVAKTTSDDKNRLMAWVFAAIALNPSVAPMASVTPAQRTAINADMARLFEALMTDTCRGEAQAAVKYEGKSAIEASFTVLGQVAGRELFASPAVAQGLAELDSLIDKKKMEDLFDTSG